MRLNLLLEDDSQAALHRVKQFALGLQQALLEKFDNLDVELKSISLESTNDWCVILEPAFENYARYRPQIDISTCMKDSGCWVGIARRFGADSDTDPSFGHMFLRSKSGDWKNPSDPNLLTGLEQRFLTDIARLVAEDVNSRVKVSPWDKTGFEPFDYRIPDYMTNSEVGLAIAKAALAGLYVRCTAIPKRGNDPIGSNKALNDFNDNVLRKAPKPLQIKVATSSSQDITFFIYATHEAPVPA